MSPLFLRCERLRLIFIDEVSTASADDLSVIGDTVRRFTRQQHSWALRSDTVERRWGGVNLVYCGDVWQVRPVCARAIIDNPFRSHTSSAGEAMLATFWTKGVDSLTGLYELTQEQRCKDKWLSNVLKAARHGTMDHETYCFMHGLPTRHAGSWMPDTNYVLCKNPTCHQLAQEWDADFTEPSPSDRAAPRFRRAWDCLLYTSPSPRDQRGSGMPASA